IVVIGVVLSVLKSSNTTSFQLSPTKKPPLNSVSPTPHSLLPTVIPPQSFTGAQINQELPIEINNIGEQKTTLRRLTPLTLSFATVEFDYENDMFLVHLSEPKEENKVKFNVWKEQNYPSLTESKFAFN
ncbi:MAG: hypothetical protein V1922_00320, partial [bacterium]